MFDLVPFILLFPVLGLLTNLIFGRYLGERLVGIIASGAAAAAFIVSVIQVFALVNNNFHAGSCICRQLFDVVCRVGRRRHMFLFVDRILVR